MRIVLIPLLLLAAGCSGMNRDGAWPTLAPRPGEISPMVPRVTAGGCGGCGQDVFAAPAVTAPAPLPPPPADAAARLEAIDTAIAAVEAKYPPQARATAAASRAASASGADSNAGIDAEVQRSRLEALFLPLAAQAKALDALADDLAGTAADGLSARLAGLRERLGRLEAGRQ
jgi:hypothetical protein